MFKTCRNSEPFFELIDFNLREITGRWVSLDGAPAVTFYRNTARKGGGIRLKLTYNNPQAEYDRRIKRLFGQHYIDLYGRIGIAYDREREVLILSVFGEYVRWEE